MSETKRERYIRILSGLGGADISAEACKELVELLKEQPERLTGRWIDHVEDGYVECPFCHSATNCDDNISDLHFCFSCGARMEGE